MKETFIDRKFSPDSLVLLVNSTHIIDEYRTNGYTLTLRQLYYQHVARGFIENTERSYKRLGSVINDGRLAGLIDWSAIEDRTRFLRSNSHWTSPGSIIRAARNSYRINMWQNQFYQVEVFVEKDALLNAIERVCQELDVPYMACRGYTSQSEEYVAAKRMAAHRENGRQPYVLYLGDHDPSGIDMTRDHKERLEMLSGGEVTINRVALNMNQIEEHDPPPNPTKLTDSRAQGYIDKYGQECWELDALSPNLIGELIRKEILRLRDEDAYKKMVAKLKAEQAQLDLLLEDLA